MNNESDNSVQSQWRPASVLVLAAVCLVLGVFVGYLLRGSESPSHLPSATNGQGLGVKPPEAMHMPSLDELKQMADKQAEPLLARLKADPANMDLLVQVGAIYQATHRFKEAAEYYRKALEIKPANVAVRTHAASCLYYAGDVDGALAELQRSLRDEPHNANALFNLGMMKWQGKQDAQGALGAWQRLLDTNPKLEPSKKADVQQLMAEVRQHSKSGLANRVSGD